MNKSTKTYKKHTKTTGGKEGKEGPCWRDALGRVFMAVFVAEWGDRTQAMGCGPYGKSTGDSHGVVILGLLANCWQIIGIAMVWFIG